MASMMPSLGMPAFADTETVTVYYEMNGHGTQIPSSDATLYSKIQEPEVPSADGYRFDGWYTTSDCIGQPRDFSWPILDDDIQYDINKKEYYIIFYAKWTKASFNVAYFDEGGGELTGELSASAPISYLTDKTVQLLEPHKDGYDFVGWYDNPECSGQSISLLKPGMFTDDIKLYAKWQAIQFDVTFKGNYKYPGIEIESAYSEVVTETFGTYYVFPDKQPVRSGYKLIGWFTASGDGGEEISAGSKVNIAAAHTLYAHWQEANYTVNFDIQNHGTYIPPAQTIGHGGKVSEPTNPSADGYMFEGWYTTSACAGEEWNFQTNTVTKDITLYAKWKGVPVEVNFYGNFTYEEGGSLPYYRNTYQEYGSNYVFPEEPEVYGYKFVGWFTTSADSGGNEISAGSIVETTNTVNLYARWQKTSHTVKFDLQGKGNSIPDYTAQHREIIKEPQPTPTSDAYTLEGWYTTSACASESKWNFETDMVTEDITLYAKWIGRFCYTDFNANYEGSTYNEWSYQQYGEKYVFPEKEPARVGYKFTGWYTASGDSGEKLSADSVVYKYVNHTIYAHWAKTDYTITFDCQMEGVSCEPKTVGYNATISKQSLPIPNEVTGYIFGGWYKDASCDSAWEGTEKVTSDITLYAKWSPGKYMVDFHPNYAGSVYHKSIEQVYGTNYSLPEDLPYREGYNFDGWYTTSGDGGQEISAGSIYNIVGSQDLYAHWKSGVYTVTFETWGIGPSVSAETVAYNQNATQPNVTMSAEGYTFDRWYKDSAYINEWKFDTDKIIKDTTIYAHWKAKTFEIIYKDMGNKAFSGKEEVLPRIHIYGKTTVLKDTSCDGYTFMGWYLDSECSAQPVSELSADGYLSDITLYAKWEANIGYALLDHQGGTSPAGTSRTLVSTKYNSPMPEISAASRPGYTLDGYYDSSSDGGKKYYNADGTSAHVCDFLNDITLYAHWTPNEYIISYYNQDGGTFDGIHENGHPTSHIFNEDTQLKDASKEGYDFEGWHLTSSCAYNVITVLKANTKAYAQDINLYAKWKIKTFDVTFNYNYGETPETEVIKQTYGEKYKVPSADPTRTGWIFNGWYTDEKFGSPVSSDSDVTITQDQTLYAHWIFNELTVKFDMNGHGSQVQPAQVVISSEGSTVSAPETPSETGYNFEGWYTTSACAEGTQWNFARPVTDTMTLYAKWTPITFNVTYVSYVPGQADEKITQTYGEKYVVPSADPVYAGQTFVGWFTAYEGGTEVSANTTVTATTEHKLHAHWSPKTFSITYYDSDGSLFEGLSENAPKTHTYGTDTELLRPTRTGYTFMGWHISADAEDESRVDTLGATGYTEDIKLYAEWKANEYLITYLNQYGNSWDEHTEAFVKLHPEKHIYGTKTVLVDALKTNHQASFGGWYLDASCNGTRITELSADGWLSPITLYAKWIGFTVTFDVQGHGTAPETLSDLLHGSYISEPTELSADGYTFGGWYTTSACANKDKWDFNNDTVTSDVTLYAKWTANEYNITYRDYGNADYSGSNKESLPKKHTYGTSTNLTDGVKDEYNFLGWYLNSDCTGNVVTTLSAEGYLADITLYAKWSIKKYTVTFNANGHGTAPATLNDISSGSKLDEPAELSANGYTFGGWYETSACAGAAWKFGATGDAVRKNLTLYAKWTAKTYGITYYNKDGEELTANNEQDLIGTHTYGVDTVLVPAEREDKTFGGWYLNSDCTGNAVTTLSAEGYLDDITLYAKWEVKMCTVELSANGHGTATASIDPVEYGQKINDPGDLSADGYTFGGWYQNSACTGNRWKFGASGNAVLDDMTLYAKWTAIEYDIIYRDYGNFDYSGSNKESLLKKHTYGTSTNLTDGVKDEYNFLGWYLNSDCTGNAVTTLSAEGYLDNITLYAKWSIKKYTVTFNANGHGTAPASITDISSSSTIARPTDPSANGYNFIDWYKNASCDGATWQFADAANPSKVTSNITLYAKWEPLKYNISYYDQGGNSLSVSSDGFPFLHTFGTKTVLPTVTKGGYRFKGWYLTASCDSEPVTVLSAEGYLADVNLYAKWEVAKYTVTFDANGYGTAPEPITNIGYKTTISAEPTMSVAGYIFGGWYENQACTGNRWKFGASGDAVLDDMTLYAKWTKDSGGGGGGGGGSGGGGEDEPDPQKELAEAKAKANTAIEKQAGAVDNRSEDVVRLVSDANAAIQAATSKEQVATIQEKYAGAIKVAINTNAVVAVQNKAVAQKSGKMKLSFKRLTLADGTKITKYEIYRKDPGKKTYKKLKTVTYTKSAKNITYTDSKKLKKGKKYSYKIRGIVLLADNSYAHTQWSKVKTIKCKKTRK